MIEPDYSKEKEKETPLMKKSFNIDYKVTVLFIDDETDFLDLAKHYLVSQESNLVVETCLVPQEALNLIEMNRYDVIVADYQMPELNGLEILRELRKKGDQTPFIILTAHGREEIIIQALNLGADYYLPKDINLKRVFMELKHIILRAAEKSRVRLEKHYAEKARLASEELFSTIFKDSPIGILLYDSKGKFLDANKASLAIYGVSSSKNLREFQLFNNPYLTGDIKEGLDKGKTVKYEEIFDFKRAITYNFFSSIKTGLIFLEVQITPLGWSGSSASRGYLVQIQDITERKQTEIKLMESEDRYRLLFNSSNDGVYVYLLTKEGLLGKFIEVNDVACQRLGYTREEFHNLSLIDIDATERAATIGQTILEDKKILYETIHLTKDGKKIPIEVNSHLFDLHGQLTVLSIARDITERKRAQKKLRESEERFRGIAERSFDAIFALDLKGDFTYVSPSTKRITGYSPEELIAKSFLSYIPVSDHNKTSQAFKKLLNGEHIQGLELELLKQNTSRAIVEINLSPIIRDNKVNGVQGIVRDITKRKQAEELVNTYRDHLEELVEQRTAELQRTNEMLQQEINVRKKVEKRQSQLLRELESANTELKDFAYVVSHDLKAPLRAITNLAEFITTDYMNKLEKDGKDLLHLLGTKVKQMNSLIDGILQYSRVGRIREIKVVVNLNELIIQVIEMISPPPNIIVKVENELPSILCEETRIRQVFQNLIDNAIKFMNKPRGEIRIGSEEEEDHWKFYVADNGSGIEEKYFKKIFQLFQTLAPRDEFESTGIGLAVVKKIIETYNGQIWVESKLNEGSIFFFRIPKNF
ncbi:MAG: PAS domain S-box protein [Candidatus Hermodarchaeota archaeon]